MIYVFKVRNLDKPVGLTSIYKIVLVQSIKSGTRHERKDMVNLTRIREQIVKLKEASFRC